MRRGSDTQNLWNTKVDSSLYAVNGVVSGFTNPYRAQHNPNFAIECLESLLVEIFGSVLEELLQASQGLNLAANLAAYKVGCKVREPCCKVRNLAISESAVRSDFLHK